MQVFYSSGGRDSQIRANHYGRRSYGQTIMESMMSLNQTEFKWILGVYRVKSLIMQVFNNETLEAIGNGSWRKIGDGTSILFWEHMWVGEQTLKNRFFRLYRISNQKRLFLNDTGFWNGQTWR